MSGESRVRVPDELEDILLEFTVNVLVDKPKEDLVSYAARYFTRLKSQRSEGHRSDELTDEAPDSEAKRQIDEKLGKRGQMRRVTIMGESFDPEKEKEHGIEFHPKSKEERERIKERTKDIFLFKHLGKKDLDEIINAMEKRKVSQGQTIIHQGGKGDFFYVIERGCFEASIAQDNGHEMIVKDYNNSGSFGELALLHNEPRAATVKATTDGVLWAVSGSTFTRLVVGNAFRRRNNYMELLDKVPELKPLIKYEKMQVCDALTSVSMEEGEVLFREGDDGNGMYFIESGTVCIYKESNTGTEVLAELKEGDYFGELALVKKQPRAGTAEARERTQLAFLDVDAFERLLGPCLDIMKRKMDEYSREPKK